MNPLRADLAAFALVALCVVAILVLAVVGQPIPEVLSTVALIAVGAATGASIPRAGTAAPAAQVTP
jgi:ribosomal protein L12E/L44/L45/RPP1/RPP2